MKNVINRQSGFTIIEVVLVLAIAGLIFLVVFLALPQLQQSQRDNERRQLVGQVISGGTECITDQGGTVCNAAGIAPYMNLSAGYTMSDGAATESNIGVAADACDGSGGVRAFSASIVLESGVTYCQDNQ